MSLDARQRMKTWLETYILQANLTKDDATTEAKYLIAFGYPDYSLTKVFFGAKNVDLIFSLDEAETEPKYDVTSKPYGFRENMPIKVWSVDKQGITGTKLKWKGELEIRRLCETYPFGSLRLLHNRSETDQRINGIIIYGTNLTISYLRDITA